MATNFISSNLFSVYQSLEPFQPFITSGIIGSKIAWAHKQLPGKEKEIKELSNRIKILSAIEKDPQIPTQTKKVIISKIAELKLLKDKKIQELKYQKLSRAQIPGLLIPFSFAGVWNTGYQLILRSMNLRHETKNSPSNLQNKNLAKIAGNSIAIFGIIASLSRQLGIISNDNPVTQGLVGLLFCINALEISILSKNLIASYFKFSKSDS